MSQNEQLDLYETLARLRDHFYGAAETLDKLVQTKVKAVTQEYDPSKIKWQQTEGQHGTYEKSQDFNSLEHKALLRDLAQHKGKLTHLGFFYWTFQDGSTIGRKKATYEKPHKQ